MNRTLSPAETLGFAPNTTRRHAGSPRRRTIGRTAVGISRSIPDIFGRALVGALDPMDALHVPFLFPCGEDQGDPATDPQGTFVDAFGRIAPGAREQARGVGFLIAQRPNIKAGRLGKISLRLPVESEANAYLRAERDQIREVRGIRPLAEDFLVPLCAVIGNIHMYDKVDEICKNTPPLEIMFDPLAAAEAPFNYQARLSR